MGSGAGGYVTIKLLSFDNMVTSDSQSPIGLKLTRSSQLLFTPAETPKRDKSGQPLPPFPSSSGPVPGNPPAVKVALGGLTNNEVKKFNLYAYTDKQLTGLMSMGTNSDPKFKLNLDIAGEATQAFGGEWAGFAVALGPAGGRFDLVAQFEFYPRWPGPDRTAVKPFQIIPVVMAFGTDSFASHYLLSLIVAQKTSDLVDTAVTQPYL
jgi:hypothetical protein